MTELNSPATNTVAFPQVDLQPHAVAMEQPSAASSSSAVDDEAKLPDALAPFVKGVHDAVDQVADKVAALLGSFNGGVSTGTDKAGEWVGAARQAVREHPFAAIGTALLIGAAVVKLTSAPTAVDD